jgi:type II secretory pathway component PulK
MKSRKRIQGVALPLVLWCIAFLAGLVILAGSMVESWIQSEARAEKRFIARQMALNGVAYGLNPAVNLGNPLLQNGSRDSEGYDVKITNESSRINPNYWIQLGNRSLFTRLFSDWGTEITASDAAIDCLTDWIDADDFVLMKGAERKEYELAGRSGYPANRPLKHIREMEAILNLSSLLSAKQGWQDDFTIWYSGKISIQYAKEPLLKALAELTPNQCQSLIHMRSGLDGVDNTADDRKLESIETVADLLGVGGKQRAALLEFFDTSGDLRRIESTGWCGGISHKIVVIAPTGSPGQIMSWEER